MEIFPGKSDIDQQSFEIHRYGFNFWNPDRRNSSPESSSSSSSSSDQGIVLASTRPKKRAGRTKFKETRHPVYRGVRSRNNNKWVCELRVPNKKGSRLWLGTYPTADMAARAHDVAALALRGKSACLNFADSVWRLPLPASNDVEEIRRAAAEAAEAFAETDQTRDQEGYEEVSCNMVNNETTVGIMEEDKLAENVKAMVEDGFGFYAQEDEEEEFDLNGLLLNMAEEPLMSPAPCVRDGRDWNDTEFETEVSLWSFSV